MILIFKNIINVLITYIEKFGDELLFPFIVTFSISIHFQYTIANINRQLND